LLLLATTAAAQELPPLAIPNPIYTTASYEVQVNRPAAAVWARVGKFCDIREWLPTTCSITAGEENALGAVRLVRNRVTEIVVGRTALSYTYTQPVRAGVPFNAYHGTLEARALTDSSSKLVYSFFRDTSMVAPDVARADAAALGKRVAGYLQNMKALAEGGTMPPSRP
jgi:hypothetical protein